jgi:hypothetical protein
MKSPMTSSRAEIEEDLERFNADMLYFDRHRQELLEKYPEHWVAIYKQQVAGASKDQKRLIRQLDRKGIPPARAFVDYLTDRDELLIL